MPLLFHWARTCLQSVCFLFFLALPLCGQMLVAHATGSTNWQTVATRTPETPKNYIAVDKKRQLLMVVNTQDETPVPSAYLCTTGQVPGNKQVEGDLKTPEGVYFVVKHIASGLDFAMYGHEAYTLNYPNPVDKLRRKTGHGIWIHGRGSEIAPLQTQGCVSLNNSDVSTIGLSINPGTPVILSNSFNEQSLARSADKTAILKKQVISWANAWGKRSASFFDFYDSTSYSLATESFSAFRNNKEKLFKSLAWITTSVHDVQVLEGPNYWVTWFFQDYKAPNMETKGIRRLYWEEQADGQFKIIGMEWIPGLQMTGTVLAEAQTGGEEATPSPVEFPEQAPDPSRPVATAPVMESLATEKPVIQPVTAADEPATNKAEKEATLKNHIAERIESWRQVWKEAKDVEAYMAFYASGAQQGNRIGKNAIRSQKARLWTNIQPTEIVLTDFVITVKNDGITATMRQEYADSTGHSDKGTKTLRFINSNGMWLIKEELWRAETP